MSYAIIEALRQGDFLSKYIDSLYTGEVNKKRFIMAVDGEMKIFIDFMQYEIYSS